MFSQAALNASLNGISALLLAGGYAAIRAGKRDVHKAFMIGAFSVSTVFLTKTRRHERSRNRRANRLAGARLREYHVPEVDIGIDECNPHESSFALFPQGCHDAIHRMGSMLVEDLNSLAGN